jgi:hypothetical protein
MFNYLRQHGEKGQTAILLALAMIGLLAMAGLALDGGMLYWNQRRAQNGADAAVIAGVTALAEHTLLDAGCGATSEDDILDMVYEYAGINEVPDADDGNVEVFYLVENDSGDRVLLTHPGGAVWEVGDTGTIPCVEGPIGLQVKASFPQRTFLAGIIGIAETNVTVDASAIVDTSKGCGDFVLLALKNDPSDQNMLKVTGAGIRIEDGGIHSNGGMHLGGGGQGIYLEPGADVEHAEGAATNINYNKIEGGPDPDAPDLGIGAADPIGVGDTFYRYADFAPDAGFIWLEVDPSMRHYINRDLQKSDIQNPDGSFINGLFVVNGDVKLNQMDRSEYPWRVTIATTGDIQISGGFNALPYARGVLFFTESDSTAPGAVKISGDSNIWAGLIAAPNGKIDFSGAKNSDLSGMIIGYEIDLSGSDNRVRHHPNYCPPNPPSVLLIQ